jgi:hypothetical protein
LTAPRPALTASWLDRSTDGRILHWEPHVLSREMACCGSGWLEAEPSFLEAGKVASQIIEVRPVEGGIELATEGWAWLRAAPWPSAGSDAAAGGSRDLKPLPRMLRWSDPPFTDGFDLTPFDAHDRPGATVRVQRPPRQAYLPFDFRYHHSAPHDRISCQPLRQQAAAFFEPLYVATLKLAGPDRFEPGSEVTVLVEGAGECAATHDFRGLVAVVGTRDSHRYLLDCRSVFQQRLSSSAPDALAEWRAACEVLGCEWPGEQPWPQRSHDRLAALSAAAEEAGLPAAPAKRWPRGVLRWLVLRACGATPQATERALLEFDAARNLAALLAALRPRAFPLAVGIDDPGARLWILHRDSLSDLPEIVALARGGDAPTLQAAAELLPAKRKWDGLLTKVRSDGRFADLAKQRINQIARALRSREPLARPEEGFAEAQAGLAREAGRPVRAGQTPPEGRQRYRDWLALTELARAWRGRVAAVLAFCERGSWPTGAPPAEVDTGELLRRVQQLAEPPALDETADPTDLARLQASVEQILHDAEHEPATDERQSILEELDARVRPRPERWAAYYAALRRTAALTRTWPRLADSLEIAVDGTGDRTRVVLFLQLAADLRQELDAAVWTDLLGAATRCALEELLASPGDPRIGAAYAEAADLARRLAGTPGLPVLQAAPPLRPAAAERQEFLSWWRDLHALDTALRQLRGLARDQERWARRARDLVRERRAAGSIRAGTMSDRLARLLDADPAGLSRAEYEELRAAALLPGEATHEHR